MAGGAGNDSYIIDNVGDQIIEQAGEGITGNALDTRRSRKYLTHKAQRTGSVPSEEALKDLCRELSSQGAMSQYTNIARVSY